MVLKKIMFRAEEISQNATGDLTIRLKKRDDGDDTIDTVATAPYATTLSSDNLFVLDRSDFDNTPKFEIGDICGISIQASLDYGGSITWNVTSVWEVEIVL